MAPKILIIDHNDSFTYNLVQLLNEAGAQEVQVCPYSKIEEVKVNQVDGILLSPGPGLPADYPKSIELISQVKIDKPILGVCMGLQLVVTCFGGRLRNLETVKHGRQVLLVEATKSALFSKIQFPTTVGLYHSWAMDESYGGDELEITATLTDGTVMAVQHKQYNIQAVQFHPESYMTTKGAVLIKNWLKLVESQALQLVAK